MKIRLALLLISTVDAWGAAFIRLAQAQTIDTSVLIALIAGLVGLATLVIQTYGQIQLAKIKDKQDAQARDVKDQGVKLAEQSVKVQEVHTLVNSGQSRLIEDVKSLTAQVAELKGERAERTRADAQEQNRLIGAARAHQSAEGETPAEPVTVQVVNPDPLPVIVKPESLPHEGPK